MVTLNDVENKNILREIFDEELVIFEDVQGSKIWINWDGENFNIKPKRLSNDNINLIDLAMQNYYNSAINYFETFNNRVRGLMPKNWWFCFEYFPDNQPANIEYHRMPKHGLVLTAINKSGRYQYDYDEIVEFSRLFAVDHLPVIFIGKLTDDMKTAIEYFLATSENDLEYVFGQKSFTFFFYKLLNPQSENSFLMVDEYQDNVEKLIIRTSKGETSFEILNPLYRRISSENSTDFTEIYTLILINFLTFSQAITIESLKLKGANKEELYISLICILFNEYYGETGEDLEHFEFIVPDFFDKEKFKINRDLIKNKKTLEIIEISDRMEYIFKIVLSSFNKKRKKPIGLFTENTVELFNKFVDEIDLTIEKFLRRKREIDLTKTDLVDFSQFFDLGIDYDGEKNVYPSVWDEIVSNDDEKKKKKGIISHKK